MIFRYTAFIRLKNHQYKVCYGALTKSDSENTLSPVKPGVEKRLLRIELINLLLAASSAIAWWAGITRWLTIVRHETSWAKSTETLSCYIHNYNTSVWLEWAN